MQFIRSESFGTQVLRRLDFDIEARPLGWLGGDWVHKEVTAIGSCWMDDHDTMEVSLLTKRDGSAERMLLAFLKRYDEADMVVGHYIRGYDLSTLQAEHIELGLPTLGEKLTHDTKNDLIKHQGISKSQENLSAMLGLGNPKVHMNVPMWREANRLTKAGLELTTTRVAGDVVQNMELHAELMKRRLLAPPKLWTPGPA
jgi:hypothetical protein